MVAEELGVEEMRERFRDEWVAVEVTAEDEAGRTVRGRLIAHGKDREQVNEAETAHGRERPEVATLVFFAGPVVDPNSGVVVVF